jgi:two-component system chemotaxis sensor kinase CheA
MSFEGIANQAAQTFRDEALELLNEIEESLLELEQDPNNMEFVAKVFRAMHTIKGSGAMFGFDEVARFTHDVETVLDRVRNKEIEVTKEMLTLILQAKDHILLLLESKEPTAEREASDALLDSFRQYLAPAKQAAPEAPAASMAAEHGHDELMSLDDGMEVSPAPYEAYWIRWVPNEDILASGNKPLGILEDMAELGPMCEIFHGEKIPPLEEYSTSAMYCSWDIILNTNRGENDIRDVFIFVEDESVIEIRKIGDGRVRSSDLCSLAASLAPLLVKDGEQISDGLRRAFGGLSQQISQEKERHAAKQASKTAELAASHPAEHPQSGQVAHGPSHGASIRVDSSRLDTLVNMVGEMVILQSRLTLAAKKSNDPVIGQIAEDMERLTDTMRDNALSLRMLPFGTTFSGLRRLVRDLSTSLNKEVEFITEGADTELDKTVIDKLKDPLMHILRNAIDHGIESAWVRKDQGKPPIGTIKLSARHSSGDVIISVVDDGKGVDADRVRAKAVERGLIAPDAELAEKDVLSLLFEPGFSTAETVSNVSGRGVGMDVVKRSIDSLRGAIDIDSKKGQGASIHIRLPLTLAIIDGMHVKIGKESYIIPLTTVEACQERFITQEINEIETIERMGKLIPCVSLRKLLQVPGAQPEYERVIVVGLEGMYIGLAVDAVVGRQQAVIKSLSEAYRKIEWISGTTVNGDGGISVILDVPHLVRFAANHTLGVSGAARLS